MEEVGAKNREAGRTRTKRLFNSTKHNAVLRNMTDE